MLAAEMRRDARIDEGDPATIESLTERMLVTTVDRARWTTRRGRTRSGRSDRSPPGIGEHEAVGIVRVARDSESVLVVHSMVSRTQCDEVPRVGRTEL